IPRFFSTFLLDRFCFSIHLAKSRRKSISASRFVFSGFDSLNPNQISLFSTSSSRDFSDCYDQLLKHWPNVYLALENNLEIVPALSQSPKQVLREIEEKMEAINLNDDGQNDVMDENIEYHEVLEDSEANRGTQPRQVQSRRRVSRCWKKFTILGRRLSDGDESVEKTEEEKEEEDKEKEKEEEKTSIFIHLPPQLGLQVSLGLSSLLFMLSTLISVNLLYVINTNLLLQIRGDKVTR
uniref:Uncharacterized protein n=2 Tax=Brassica oleracea TaxID=3712 RepID=A0A0D3CJV0_BRAOL